MLRCWRTMASLAAMVCHRSASSLQSRGSDARRDWGAKIAMRTHRSRREVLAAMRAGVVALTLEASYGGIGPRRARAAGSALRILSEGEGRTLEALGDTLLPGASEAGIAHYIDDQLGRDNPLFILKYLDYPAPYADLYKQGLAALGRLSMARHSKPFEDCTP